MVYNSLNKYERMEVFSSFVHQNVKAKIFSFFAFVFFSGLFSVFAYYKIFGGVGFKVALGYMSFVPGVVSLVLIMTAFVGTLILSRMSQYEGGLSVVVSVVLLLFVVNQALIWSDKINEGLFLGGGVLSTLGVDDVVYFSLYYFVTFFVMLFALVLSVFFLIHRFCKNKVDDVIVLCMVLKPLFFASIGVFVLFYLWK